MMQKSLQNWKVVKNIWQVNDKRATDSHFAIGEMIADNNQPYKIVKNECIVFYFSIFCINVGIG